MAYYYISLEKPIYQNHQDNDKLTDISENSQLFKIFNKYGWKENYEHKGVCKYDENKKFIGYCTKYNLVDAHNYADEKSTIKLFEKDIPKYEKSEYNLYTKEILFRKDGLNIKEVDKLFEFGFDGYICSKSELITFINEYAINKSDFGEFISKFIDGETFFQIC